MEHSHDHHHEIDGNINNKFKIGILLNIIFVAVEFLMGVLTNSLALIADAGHNLSDVLSLLIAWGASYLVLKKPSNKFTYGLKKSSILAAQLNSFILLAAVGIIIWEAIERISSPSFVNGSTLIIVAGIGVIVNGLTAYLFHSGKDNDLNIKGAYLHMFADTIISVGVVVSGVIILLTGQNWIDPVISIIIALVIFWSTWKLLQEATRLSLDAVPESINIESVRKYFKELDDVHDYHDLHVWALSTTENALTVHIVIDDSLSNDKVLEKINNDLAEKFGNLHTTIQIEQRECSFGC